MWTRSQLDELSSHERKELMLTLRQQPTAEPEPNAPQLPWPAMITEDELNCSVHS